MTIIVPNIFWQRGDANDNVSQHRGYLWWYLDGLFIMDHYTLVISFHISNKSMMSFSGKSNPAYKLTVARISKQNLINSVEILFNKKVSIRKNFFLKPDSITFGDDYLKKDTDKLILALKQPEIELSVTMPYSPYISPRILFPTGIFMQQIQYSTGAPAQLRLTNHEGLGLPKILNGTSYVENVFGNRPCFFMLHEWFWLRINSESANIVIAYAKTNFIGFFKPMSMIHIQFKNGRSFSAENSIYTQDFKEFFINHPELKLIISITLFSHFQNYSPFSRIKGQVGEIANKLLDAKCIRSYIRANILMQSYQQDFIHRDCVGICEIRSFYGYKNKLQ